MRLPGPVALDTEKEALLNGARNVVAPDSITVDALYDKKYTRLRRLMIFTGFVHVCIAVAIIALFYTSVQNGGPNTDGHVERVAVCWSPSGMTKPFLTITNKVSTTGGVSRQVWITILLIIFFVLSAIFQFTAVYQWKSHRESTFTNAPQKMRYVEYSITASCMMIVVFLGIGLLDIYLHLCVFVLTAVCMLTGLLADYLRHYSTKCPDSKLAIQTRHAMVGAHLISWVCMMVPWIIVFIAFNDMQRQNFQDLCDADGAYRSPESDNEGMPSWVVILIIVQFALFNVFGLVQVSQFRRQFCLDPRNTEYLHPKDKTYHPTATGLAIEWWFVFLSLFSKAFLGVLLSFYIF